MKITDQVKLGIKIYSYDENLGKMNTDNHFFFNDKLIKFNIKYLRTNFIKLLFKIIPSIKSFNHYNDTFKLKSSFLKPPLNYLKREISLVEGR